MSEQKQRAIGDRVFVVADNYGSEATIIEIRESDESPPSHYKVQTNEGDQMQSQEFWAFDHEIHDLPENPRRTWGDVFRAAVRRGDDHGYAAHVADEYVKRNPPPEAKPAAYDSRPDTLQHISKVQERMLTVLENLTRRGKVHDRSKLEEPEKSGYDALTIKLKDCEYGSDAYRAALAEAKPVIDHHYAHNSHHPEHYPNGIADMSLLDIVEMLCDWKAASERTKQGSIAQSLAHNKQRFGVDDQLAAILENTVKELGW